jgi:hypothetical protein
MKKLIMAYGKGYQTSIRNSRPPRFKGQSTQEADRSMGVFGTAGHSGRKMASWSWISEKRISALTVFFEIIGFDRGERNLF